MAEAFLASRSRCLPIASSPVERFRIAASLMGKLFAKQPMIHPKSMLNNAGPVDDHTVCLPAFRTVEPFQGKGYFSKLLHFMTDDLQQKGFTKATLGVVPSGTKNKEIYAHDGFSEYVKSGRESYPDGTIIDVEYYGKTLA